MYTFGYTFIYSAIKTATLRIDSFADPYAIKTFGSTRLTGTSGPVDREDNLLQIPLDKGGKMVYSGGS